MTAAPTVRPARVADAAAISRIYCETLGAGYTTPDAIAREIAEATRLRSRSRSCWYVAERPAGGHGPFAPPTVAPRSMQGVVGAANAVWVPRASVSELGMPGFQDVQQQLLALAPGAARFGLLENVGVLTAHRGLGIGGALTSARLAWLRGLGVSFAYSFAWHTPAGCAAEPALRRAGFQFVRELPDFYLEDGLTNGYACPWCGPACHCSARLFVLALDPGPGNRGTGDEED
ncbi:MAG: GNAT family N-acetyltransferase [Candidatus Dormiibacterota bacterium]